MRDVLRRLHGDDAGFGLIEAVVALLIAGIVFSALAASLISAVGASMFARQNQQATDFANRELERLRATDFGALAHVAADLAGDPRLVSCAAPACLPRPDGTLEPVITGATGGVVPHVQLLSATLAHPEDVNHTDFTVHTYITQSDQPVDQAVRATVYVTWTTGGQVHERSATTVIAYTQRGLPLPVFRLEVADDAKGISPGDELTYKVRLINQGAPDYWTLSWVGDGSNWKFYEDTDGDGAFDATADTMISQTDRIDPASEATFFFVTSSLTGLGGYSTEVVARSVGQPTAAGAEKRYTVTTTVTSGVVVPTPTPTPTGPPLPPEITCAAPTVPAVSGVNNSYTVRGYTLHNDGFGDTPTLPLMYWDFNPGDETALWRYSTDVSATATGRVLAPAGPSLPTPSAVLALTDPTRYVDWARQLTAKTAFDGTPVVRVWVASDVPVQLQAIVYRGTSSGATINRTEWATQTVTVGGTCPGGFQETYIALPTDLARTDLPVGSWFGVRLVTAGGSPVRLAYDVAGPFDAQLRVGVK